jgi:hypothetical protein
MASNLERIAVALERIVAFLEKKPKKQKLPPEFIPKYAGLLPKRYVPHHASILIICQSHLRDENRDRKIVDAMKVAGIIAKSTYWKDVNFFDPILKLLERNSCPSSPKHRNSRTPETG